MMNTNAYKLHVASVLGGMLVAATITAGCSEGTDLSVGGSVIPTPAVQVSMTPSVSTAPSSPSASPMPSESPSLTPVPTPFVRLTPYPFPSPTPVPNPMNSSTPTPSPASTSSSDGSLSPNIPNVTSPSPTGAVNQIPNADISVKALLQEMREGLGIIKKTNGAPFAPPSNISDWLNKLAIKYDSKYGIFNVHTIQVDKNGGLPTWATVLYVEAATSEGNKGAQPSRQSVGVIVTQTLGGYVLGTVDFPMDVTGTSKVEIPGDLTGDGNKEIVWSWVVNGAHTSTTGYVVSQWETNKWSMLPGEIVVKSVNSLQLINGTLVIKGGLIGSAGAGPWQRESTETYKYKDGSMKLVESIKVNGTTAYHSLEDALTSESLGYWERAAQQFGAAVNKKEESYQGLLLQYHDKLVEGNTNLELESQFRDAVNAFARLRLQLLEFDHNIAGKYSSLLGPDKGSFAGLSEVMSHVKNREEAVKVVQEWSHTHPNWLVLLNAPFGYANQRWDKDMIFKLVNAVKEL